MKFPALLTAALVASLPFPLSAEERRGDSPDAKPLTPEEQLKRFKVPPGFEVQLVASEPEIQKPVNLNFDAAGRLWMTGSEMYPWPAATDAAGKPLPNFQKAYEDIANAFSSKGKAPAVLPEGRDTVRILSDFGPDGRARKIDIFADKLNIPTGIQPLPRKPGAKGDSAIVYSIPNIWRFEDTDGDGKTDKREALYEGFGYLDTHGMSSNYIYWIDGWIYGCHGFRNHSEVKDRNGNVTVFDSGNTYRFKPDGSKIEYWSYGQTNPFGLAFDPLGNLYSADSHSKPVYLLLKGGHYEGIGKNHDGLGFAPRITDDDHGSSAIAGVMYYADDKWPKEFHGNLFNGNPVTNRINRATLEWHGSTPKATRVADFVTCDDPWFRPVQTKLGPDGALYIADFYNPIIGHYEVPLSDPRRDRTHGRIWRVVWRGEKGDQAVAQAPDLSGMDWKSLMGKLEDPNLEVRRLATNQLADRLGKEGRQAWSKAISEKVIAELRAKLIPGVEPLPGNEPEKYQHDAWSNATWEQRKCLLWVLHRIGELTDYMFRQAVAVSAARGTTTMIWPGPKTRIDALRLAADLPGSDKFEEAMIYRQGVQAALKPGYVRDVDPASQEHHAAIDPLAQRVALSAMARYLVNHPKVRTGTFAEQAGPSLDEGGFRHAAAFAAQAGNDTELRHTARMAMRDVLLKPGKYEDVLAEWPDFIEHQLEEYFRRYVDQIADVSLAVPTPDAADFFLKYIRKYGLSAPRTGEFLRHAALHLPEDRISEVISTIEKLGDTPLPQRLAAADGLNEAARKRGITLPESATAWMQRTMIAALASTDAALLDRAIAAVRDAKLKEKYEPLRKIIGDTKGHGPRRAAALESLLNHERSREVLVASLNDTSSMTLRKRAAELLGQSNKKEDGDALLAALLVAPTELATIIATSLAKTDDGLTALLAAVESGRISPRVLLTKAVAGTIEKRSAPLRKNAADLTENLPPEDGRLDQLIAQRVTDFRGTQADTGRGQLLFQQQCAACHKLKNNGGNIGPNLDGVASRGVHRLLEDILDPNRNVDPAFRQTMIETNDGRTLAGVNLRTDGELVLLSDAAGQEVSVQKTQVKSQNQSHLSLMPAAFEHTLSSKDLSDLVGYLLGQ